MEWWKSEILCKLLEGPLHHLQRQHQEHSVSANEQLESLEYGQVLPWERHSDGKSVWASNLPKEDMMAGLQGMFKTPYYELQPQEQLQVIFIPDFSECPCLPLTIIVSPRDPWCSDYHWWPCILKYLLYYKNSHMQTHVYHLWRRKNAKGFISLQKPSAHSQSLSMKYGTWLISLNFRKTQQIHWKFLEPYVSHRWHMCLSVMVVSWCHIRPQPLSGSHAQLCLQHKPWWISECSGWDLFCVLHGDGVRKVHSQEKGSL